MVNGLSTASLHDACVLVAFITPHLIDYKHCPVVIELGQGATREMTVCDLRDLTGAKLESIAAMDERNCNVAIAVEARTLIDTILVWPPAHRRIGEAKSVP